MAVAEASRKTTMEGQITDEDLMRLPRDGRKWELVDGEATGSADKCKT